MGKFYIYALVVEEPIRRARLVSWVGCSRAREPADTATLPRAYVAPARLAPRSCEWHDSLQDATACALRFEFGSSCRSVAWLHGYVVRRRVVPLEPARFVDDTERLPE